ncbi:hypothetical protein [Clostridium estertheticum]|uniref:hypothetical protein n=1 Tax=Clostridium estertheticum TaxID=238834 RepID=UPI001C0DEBC3|nr:hypothetical protein [Clostridium estertheticum]MBU3072659.1 hypothetical protein [Clostridium estertheticum]MBU3162752.1 hypothetical protein [Clostridium estertheticum]MBU3184964.1 hypothetical protein [Clostridium estertheticum]MCB2340150.1 hypothetical protein [Clostridium estertheticum]
MNNIEKEKEIWSKQKTMGKKKFVLIYGVLIFGGISSLVYFILTKLFISNLSNIIVNIITYTIIMILIGVFLSNKIWNANVKKFENK